MRGGTVGNAGGYGYDKEYRLRQGELKKRVVLEMIAIMNGNNRQEKMAIITKIGPNCIPREVEGTGEGGAFVIKIVNYDGDSSAAQVRSEDEAVPTEDSPESGAV